MENIWSKGMPFDPLSTTLSTKCYKSNQDIWVYCCMHLTKHEAEYDSFIG